MNTRIREMTRQIYGPSLLDHENFVMNNDKMERFAELLIGEYAEELRQLNEGERVVLPKDREHAQALVTVGMHYLEQNK